MDADGDVSKTPNMRGRAMTTSTPSFDLSQQQWAAWRDSDRSTPIATTTTAITAERTPLSSSSSSSRVEYDVDTLLGRINVAGDSRFPLAPRVEEKRKVVGSFNRCTASGPGGIGGHDNNNEGRRRSFTPSKWSSECVGIPPRLEESSEGKNASSLSMVSP